MSEKEISGSPERQRNRMFKLLELLKEFETENIDGFEDKYETYRTVGIPLEDLFAEYKYRYGGSDVTLSRSYLDPLLKKGKIVETTADKSNPLLHSKEFLEQHKKEQKKGTSKSPEKDPHGI